VSDERDERPLPAPRIASELPRVQAGDLVLIDPRGAVMSRRRARVRGGLVLGTLAAACGIMFAVDPLLGGIYTGVLALRLVPALLRTRRMRAIVALIAVGDLDRGERELDRFAQRASRRWRANVVQARAVIAWKRGQLERALAECEACAVLLPAPRRGFRVVYWQNLFNHAHVLLELDRAGEAWPLVERAAGAPPGEWYQLQLRALRLHDAFARGRDGDLGSDDDLHDRVRDLLRYNHTGVSLAMLAWAYEARGDAEMTTHLLGEVPARFLAPTGTVASMYPRLWAWLAPKLEAVEAAAAEEPLP
jgi:hypothetical protein